jgi:hypothetical protein
VPGEEELADAVGPELAKAGQMLSGFFRLFVFYALLQVVIEAYDKIEERSAELDALLADGPKDRLKRLRNAVFHVQSEPFNPRLWDFLLLPDSEKWVHRVRSAFERYFRERLPIDDVLAAFQK